ncbi:DUF397 domain-containing protein [Sphaerisporangium corydalis]|uniref:DUF397 domain-containing protein n=1 Tax=Sphaerisporangium corydalis TaxID=1441875 RepID=A0ABV9EA74_9ACTN|nr:DUF397 domain-containing protein [Sphaerisporangium corydalis]
MDKADLNSAAWRKSTRSGDAVGSGCVEVSTNLPGVVAVRDSKNPTGPVLMFVPGEWSRFRRGVFEGIFGR